MILLNVNLLASLLTLSLFLGQVKDSGYNDNHQCREIAKQFVADSEIVGVVGAFRSTCSIKLNQYFKTSCKLQ